MKNLLRTIGAGLLVLCLAWGQARASVIINGTRVVFPAQQGEVTVRLSNVGKHPALIEAWIDKGNPRSTPNSVHTPFLITPPLFRMNPHRDQSLRIVFISGSKPLPTNRESLFWLNVLEIPPKPTGAAAGENTLQFAIRSRIKLFYRPPKLPGSAIEAPAKLTFKAAAQGQRVTLSVHNPTPYYITISHLSLALAGKTVTADTGMVAPFGDLKLAVKGLTHLPAAGTPVAFTTINDYGAGDTHKAVIAP